MLTLAYESDVGYRLTGILLLRSVLSWPQITISAHTKSWQVAPFLANSMGARFTHEATIRFDGQRITPRQLFDAGEPTDFAIPLMVDVEHTVRLGEVGIGQSITWRTFQVIRLWSPPLFAKALGKWATPISTKPADIRGERTGSAPWRDKLAAPIGAYEAGVGVSVFNVAAVNNGAFAGSLAAKLAAHLSTAAPQSMVVEFSDHVLLAFDPLVSDDARLKANPVLVSLPALGFAGADSLPADPMHALNLMLACQPQHDAKLYLSESDRYEAHIFPALDPRLAQEAVSRAKGAAAMRTREVADAASAAMAFDPSRAHKAVFQALTFKAVSGKTPIVPVDDMPTAATAFHLSKLFEQQIDTTTGHLRDASPLAIGFARSGHVSGLDFYEDADDDPLGKASDFNRRDYAWALARLRDWSLRNIVIFPRDTDGDPDRTADVAEIWTALLEAPSRDGLKVIDAAVTKLPIRNEVDLKVLESNCRSWAVTALQRAAPWAGVGLLTLRRRDFGVESDVKRSEVIERVDPRGYRPSATRALYPDKTALAPQLQLEYWPTHDRAAAPAGYVPVSVMPALFASEAVAMPDDTTDGPRLTATGAETAWRLTDGTHAILEDREDPGNVAAQEAFWIADRERIGFRPFAQPPQSQQPFDLSLRFPPVST